MFEKLTAFIPDIESGDNGSLGINEYGYPEQQYSSAVFALMSEIGGFAETYKKADLHDYFRYTEDIDWDHPEEMRPVSAAAYLVSRVRGERFCDGCFIAAVDDGTVLTCLRVLEKADREGRKK